MTGKALDGDSKVSAERSTESFESKLLKLPRRASFWALARSKACVAGDEVKIVALGAMMVALLLGLVSKIVIVAIDADAASLMLTGRARIRRKKAVFLRLLLC
jgi:hypothetical protein